MKWNNAMVECQLYLDVECPIVLSGALITPLTLSISRCKCRETMQWNDAIVECQLYLDMNFPMILIGTYYSTYSVYFRCECRETMKWNDATLECQFYLDVDCSKEQFLTRLLREKRLGCTLKLLDHSQLLLILANYKSFQLLQKEASV